MLDQEVEIEKAKAIDKSEVRSWIALFCPYGCRDCLFWCTLKQDNLFTLLMLTFRPAQVDDLPLLVQMLADDPLGKQREDFRIPLPQSYSTAFQQIDQDPNQELMVFLDAEANIAGMFQLSFLPYLTYRGGTRAQMEGVRIRKDLRGQGLGTQVFNWAIQRAKERGAHVLQLTTDKKRPDALRFYEKLGFVASHEGMKLHL